MKKLTNLNYFKNKFITIAMPAYNEAKNLPFVVKDANLTLKKITSKYAIIILNDGSTDNSGEVLSKLSKRYKKLNIITFTKNRGVGAALFEIYRRVAGDFLFINAADGQIKMNQLLKLLPFMSGRDIVVGQRIKRRDSLKRKTASKIYSLFLYLFFKLPVKDIDSVKLYRVSSLKRLNLESQTAFIEAEILIKATKNKFRITEIPIEHFSRKNGQATGLKLKIVLPQLIDLAKILIKR